MRMKTSMSYKNEILDQYNREKGGDMSSYLLKPTRKQIKEACIWLLDKRKGKYDEQILNRFFKFKDGEDKLQAIESMKGDKFKPIVNFLTGETKSTTPANMELISWLIDFKQRPLSVYLRPNAKNLSKDEIKLPEINEPKINPVYRDKEIDRINIIPETKVIEKTDKSITIISQINPTLKITTIVSL